MSEDTASTMAIDPTEKGGEAARRAVRFVSEKVVSTGSAAAERAGRMSRRMARTVSEKIRSGASKGSRAALSRLTDAGMKVTEKQQEALKRLKGKVSDS